MSNTEQTFTFTFSGRESYLAWVAEWKAKMAVLVAEHTRLKRQGMGYVHRDEITAMIAERRAAKVEAANQYAGRTKVAA